MFVRIIQSLSLTVWNYDDEAGEASFQREFLLDEVFAVGEFSDDGRGNTCMELLGLGIVEIPNDVWVLDATQRFWFAPDRPSKN